MTEDVIERDPTTDDAVDNPALLIVEAVRDCLALAETWLAWDGRPIARDNPYGGRDVWTPCKALRRIADHLVDHLHEVEALLAGAEPIPEKWHGRFVTLDADWSRFTELDLDEARSRLPRLARTYLLRYAAAGPVEWDRPRGQAWTLRQIAEHLASVRQYAEQIGRLD